MQVKLGAKNRLLYSQSRQLVLASITIFVIALNGTLQWRFGNIYYK